MKYEAIVDTGEVIVREMTSEEILQDEKNRAEVAAKELEQAQEAAEAAAAKAALLAKLGITEEEAKLLLS